MAELSDLMLTRCQHNKEVPSYQCGLAYGHKGEHMASHEIVAYQRLNANPTLDAIRRVVREEIKAALTAAEKP